MNLAAAETYSHSEAVTIRSVVAGGVVLVVRWIPLISFIAPMGLWLMPLRAMGRDLDGHYANSPTRVERIETARVHRDSLGRGSGLAACHAQRPATASDQGFLQGASADQLAHLTACVRPGSE